MEPSKLCQGKEVDTLRAAQLQVLFGAHVPVDMLGRKARRGVGSRERVFTPKVTFWAFLGQVLDPGSSCRKAVARLPVRWLMALLQHVTP